MTPDAASSNGAGSRPDSVRRPTAGAMKRRRFFVCLLVSFTAVAITASQDAPGLPSQLDQLDRAEHKWQANKTVAYEFRFHYFCGFLLPQGVEAGVLFRVKNGEGQVVAPADIPASVSRDLVRHSTVERAFDLVRAALTRGSARVDVQYDPDRGYPTQVCVDPDVQAFDDQYGFRITEFKVIDAAK
jgi:hypothetical protein